MRFILRKISIKKAFLITGILLVIIGSLLNAANITSGSHWANQRLITHDNATFLVTAISHNKDLGLPYKDYWEYRPPGFFLLIDLWAKVIGSQVFSFKILEALTRFFIGIQILFLIRKIFSPFKAFVTISLTLLFFYSPAFGQWLFPEAYAMFFSLMGLLCLVYIKRLGLRFFLAAFFLSLSAQLKDTFWGASLAIIPPLFYFLIPRDYKSFLKGLVFTFLGLFLPLFLLSFYLINLGSLDAYFEVLRFKSERSFSNFYQFLRQYYFFFRTSNKLVTFFHDPTLIILFISFLLILISIFKNKIFLLLNKKNNTLTLKIPSLRFSIGPQGSNIITVLFYSLGSFIGPSMMYLFTPHYLFSIIIPTCFLWAIIAFFIENILRGLFKNLKRNLIFLTATILLLFPQDWIMVQYQKIPANLFKQAYKNLTLPDADTSMERYINSKTDHDDCILSLYGWKSSEIYLYSERRPCSRFIIPNIVFDEWQEKEYRNSILQNPPQAIVYSLAGADMKYLPFESEVINITRILDACYQQDLTYTDNGRWLLELYFPIFSGENLKTCIKENAG